MAVERTLGIIKPDVVPNQIGNIIQHFTDEGLRIVALKMVHLTESQAHGFYEVHKERPFFKGLVHFMTSGPVVVLVLEGENAVIKNREVMGSTDSKKAASGTIRQKYGTDIERNAIHGSDSKENAALEIAYFFPKSELLSR